ncbi:ankyrin repeat domain-containing protein [uncultured Pseudoteredinibacter sp.]|uniref:ankyrin repeat domain-containing protein n=1 Tax=uncultured Pseudoteredinibacter sp. TaxID=1641701 RepID=UPI002602DE9F|nr:ankyrin repeat domain-containing protein [uncultured Pseudoteredinibacter sp.]
MSQELIEAVRNKKIDSVRKFIADGFDLEYCDNKKMTALSHCCEVQSLDILKILVEAGANVNHKDELGYRPIDIAGWYGEYRNGAYTKQCLDIIAYLKEHGGESFNKKSQ